jgi:uncharacterized protein YbjT (DUF2867 family)
MKSTVLVLGATGMVGSHVVRELAERGEPVRAFVRDPGRAAQLLSDTVPLAAGDLTEPGTLDAALEGVGRVLLCMGNRPDQAHLEISAIDACRRAGVGRMVKISAKGAQVGSPVPFWDQHAHIEDHLWRSGIPSVVLRPRTYASNLLASAAVVGQLGRLFAPAGSTRIAFVDPRDVASVAVSALLEAGHVGRTYTLTGPQSLTFAQVAQCWGEIAGRPVEYVDVPDEAARASLLGLGIPPWIADGIVAVFGQLRQGTAAGVNDQVERILGRPAGPVEEFLRAFLVDASVPAR